MNEEVIKELEDASGDMAELKAGLSYSDAPAVDSQQAWDELNDWLPATLDQLLASEPFNEDNPPPAVGRGIYLFSEGMEHLYVGRTGITARSRVAGREPSTNFLNRWDQHSGPNQAPNSAPFAKKLAHELALAFDLEDPRALKERLGLDRTEDWWRLRTNEEPPDYYFAFQEAKRFVRKAEYRIIAFDDDVRGVRSHVAEVYTDAVLQATFGDFSTS